MADKPRWPLHGKARSPTQGGAARREIARDIARAARPPNADPRPRPGLAQRIRVGILLETESSWHHAILEGIADYIANHAGWMVYIPGLGDIALTAPRLSKLRLRGVISGDLPGAPPEFWQQRLRVVKRLSVPTVLALSQPLNFGLSEVVPDDQAAGKAVAEHLLRQGFRHFGYYGGRLPYALIRGQGFTQTLRAAGRECSMHWREAVPWGRLYLEWETRPLKKWLLGLPRPTAVMACSDLWARHVSYTCEAMGLRIPEDIALVGVDNNLAICRIVTPPLTSVPLDPRRIGYTAAGLLASAMAGKDLPGDPVRVPPLALVARHSTDLLIVDDSDIAAAARLIRESAANAVTVEDILDRVHISRSKLDTGFKRNFGRTPQKEIARIHVERAKMLLEQTTLKMPAIARGCGFPDARRLHAVFRREVGMSPRAWRNKGDTHK